MPEQKEVTIKRGQVTSSNLKSVGYDEASSTLDVEFKNGGVFRYEGVPARVHRELMAADSVGKAFHHLIKKAFKGRKLPPDQGQPGLQMSKEPHAA